MPSEFMEVPPQSSDEGMAKHPSGSDEVALEGHAVLPTPSPSPRDSIILFVQTKWDAGPSRWWRDLRGIDPRKGFWWTLLLTVLLMLTYPLSQVVQVGRFSMFPHHEVRTQGRQIREELSGIEQKLAIVRDPRGRLDPADALVLDETYRATRPHSETEWWVAGLQLLQVIALAVLWFVVCKIKDRVILEKWQTLVAVVVTVIYAILMREEYIPAVLVMAIVAIILAAEHFATLEGTDEKMHETRLRLDAAADRISDLSRTAGGTQRALDDAAIDIRSLLKFEEGDVWRLQMYGEMRAAKKRVSAVVRYWDIDIEFVRQITGAPRSVSTPSQRWEIAWHAYTKKTEGPTLYTAFHGPQRDKGWRLRYLYRPPDGLLPTSGLSSEILASFAGLIWQTTVMGQANREIRESLGQQIREREGGSQEAASLFRALEPFSFRIGSSRIWVHIIEDRVYEVVRTEESIAKTRVRQRTRLPNSSTTTEEDEHGTITFYKKGLDQALGTSSRGRTYVSTELFRLTNGIVSGSNTNEVASAIGLALVNRLGPDQTGPTLALLQSKAYVSDQMQSERERLSELLSTIVFGYLATFHPDAGNSLTGKTIPSALLREALE